MHQQHVQFIDNNAETITTINHYNILVYHPSIHNIDIINTSYYLSLRLQIKQCKSFYTLMKHPHILFQQTTN